MTAPSIREAVARAICTADERNGGPPWEVLSKTTREILLEQADAALAIALPILREHYAGVVEAWAAEVERKAPQSVTIVQARMHASHIRADEGPK